MKQPLRSYVEKLSDTVTMGAAGDADRFTDNMIDLYSVIESILAADGQKPAVSQILVHQRIYSEHVFRIIPIVVQTAGTWTDTVDIAGAGILDVTLDSCIDDVFGYQTLKPNFQGSRRVPSSDATSASGREQALENTVQIPSNILMLLNKEAETERLQNLYYGYVGMASSNNQVLDIDIMIEIKFKGIRKTLILR